MIAASSSPNKIHTMRGGYYRSSSIYFQTPQKSRKKVTKQTIAVVGATGDQGRAVVNSIVSDPTYTVRALTSDPSTDAALLLRKAGAEVMEFDLDKPETFPLALDGIHGLFIATDQSPRQRKKATAVAKAAKLAGVQHIIWSTMEDTTAVFDALDENERPPKMDGYYVPRFDEKERINEVFPKEKTTFLYTSFQLEHLYDLINKEGMFCNNAGHDTKIPVISVQDIGKCAFGIFKAGHVYRARNVYIASEKVTSAELMDAWAKVTGRPFQYSFVDRTHLDGGVELANMYEYFRRDPGYGARRDVAATKLFNPELQSVKEWAELHKTKLLHTGIKDD